MLKAIIQWHPDSDKFLIKFISIIAFRNNVWFLPGTATYLLIHSQIPTFIIPLHSLVGPREGGERSWFPLFMHYPQSKHVFVMGKVQMKSLGHIVWPVIVSICFCISTSSTMTKKLRHNHAVTSNTLPEHIVKINRSIWKQWFPNLVGSWPHANFTITNCCFSITSGVPSHWRAF